MITVLVACCLVNNNNDYLFIRQDKKGGAYPNTLHLPGGRIEPSENPSEAVRREVLEETSLELAYLQPYDFDWDTIYYKGSMSRLIYLRYLGYSRSRQAVPGTDAKEAAWISRADLGKHSHNPPTSRLLHRLGLLPASVGRERAPSVESSLVET